MHSTNVNKCVNKSLDEQCVNCDQFICRNRGRDSSMIDIAQFISRILLRMLNIFHVREKFLN